MNIHAKIPSKTFDGKREHEFEREGKKGGYWKDLDGKGKEEMIYHNLKSKRIN